MKSLRILEENLTFINYSSQYESIWVTICHTESILSVFFNRARMASRRFFSCNFRALPILTHKQWNLPANFAKSRASWLANIISEVLRVITGSTAWKLCEQSNVPPCQHSVLGWPQTQREPPRNTRHVLRPLLWGFYKINDTCKRHNKPQYAHLKYIPVCCHRNPILNKHSLPLQGVPHHRPLLPLDYWILMGIRKQRPSQPLQACENERERQYKYLQHDAHTFAFTWPERSWQLLQQQLPNKSATRTSCCEPFSAVLQLYRPQQCHPWLGAAYWLRFAQYHLTKNMNKDVQSQLKNGHTR